ncbi:hypothetical protein B0H10DRAFT_1966113 [Mycena sp. CBHHK59/15]|nr:hypothetical protein B0H10DRAFT_1966113 [Mycena sp. CBHHK59/15]
MSDVESGDGDDEGDVVLLVPEAHRDKIISETEPEAELVPPKQTINSDDLPYFNVLFSMPDQEDRLSRALEKRSGLRIFPQGPFQNQCAPCLLKEPVKAHNDSTTQKNNLTGASPLGTPDLAASKSGQAGGGQNCPAFDPKLWIGVGKTYPSDPPWEVISAKNAVLELPAHAAYLIPPRDTPVARFLERKLHKQSSELALGETHLWFSKDAPKPNGWGLLEDITRGIPPRSVLDLLRRKFPQAWLDGCQSISDPRFNDGADRLPLWTLTFWEKMAEVAKHQALWKRSAAWLDTEMVVKVHFYVIIPYIFRPIRMFESMKTKERLWFDIIRSDPPKKHG